MTDAIIKLMSEEVSEVGVPVFVLGLSSQVVVLIYYNITWVVVKIRVPFWVP